MERKECVDGPNSSVWIIRRNDELWAWAERVIKDYSDFVHHLRTNKTEWEQYRHRETKAGKTRARPQ